MKSITLDEFPAFVGLRTKDEFDNLCVQLSWDLSNTIDLWGLLSGQHFNSEYAVPFHVSEAVRTTDFCVTYSLDGYILSPEKIIVQPVAVPVGIGDSKKPEVVFGHSFLPEPRFGPQNELTVNDTIHSETGKYAELGNLRGALKYGHVEFPEEMKALEEKVRRFPGPLRRWLANFTYPFGADEGFKKYLEGHRLY